VNSEAPIREPAGERWSGSWVLWFKQIQLGLFAWRKSLTASVTHDFGSVSAASQSSTTATVTGARVGDATFVSCADTAGIVFTCAVTANDTITITAKNFTGVAVDPAPTTFRIIVFQQ
jgi:hypothetical protein